MVKRIKVSQEDDHRKPEAKPSDSEGSRGHKPTKQPGRTPAPPPPPPAQQGQGGS